jgi:hypothetical protein
MRSKSIVERNSGERLKPSMTYPSMSTDRAPQPLVETGSAWRPRCGSMVYHRALPASMIDSREFLAARRRADAELLAPTGARIAFTGRHRLQRPRAARIGQ